MLPLCWKGKQGICRGRAPEGILRLDFTALLVGAALLVLTVPGAHAQSGGAEAMAQPGMEGPGRYLVAFGLDQATLTEQDRRVIAQAAEDTKVGTPSSARHVPINALDHRTYDVDQTGISAGVQVEVPQGTDEVG